MKKTLHIPTAMEPLFIAVFFGSMMCALPLSFDSVHETVAKSKHNLTRFVVISIQRSGTGWLDSTLDSHPCINMGAELFCGPGKDFWHTSKRKTAIDLYFDEGMETHNEAEKAFLEAAPQQYQNVYNAAKVKRGVFANHKKTGDARGFDWKINAGVFEMWPWFLEFCKKHDVKIIWLRRKHYLRQYISNVAMKRNHSAHVDSKDEAETLRNKKVTLPIKQMFNAIDSWEDTNVHMKHLLFNARLDGIKTLSLVYEDMMKTPHILDNAISFVLDASTCKIQHSRPTDDHFEKVHTGELKDLIANWPEVHAALEGSDYQYLLKDELALAQ